MHVHAFMPAGTVLEEGDELVSGRAGRLVMQEEGELSLLPPLF
jgi:hypothetical protein